MWSIQRSGVAQDEILERKTIYQLDCCVVSHLQLFRKLSDGNRFPIRKALNRQQGLMLLRGQSHGSSRQFTKAQKLAQIKAKRSQFLVFFRCDAMRCALFLSNYSLGASCATGIFKFTHRSALYAFYGC